MLAGITWISAGSVQFLGQVHIETSVSICTLMHVSCIYVCVFWLKTQGIFLVCVVYPGTGSRTRFLLIVLQLICITPLTACTMSVIWSYMTGCMQYSPAPLLSVCVAYLHSPNMDWQPNMHLIWYAEGLKDVMGAEIHLKGVCIKYTCKAGAHYAFIGHQWINWEIMSWIRNSKCCLDFITNLIN